MARFFGTTKVSVFSEPKTDQYGQAVLPLPRSTKVSVIKFFDQVIQTPLRMEMSASHGRLEEDVAEVIVLVDPEFSIQQNDIMDLFDTRLQVTNVWPRQDVFGVIDHIQVGLKRVVTKYGK